MKADVLHSEAVKESSPLEGGLGWGNFTSLLGPAGLDRGKQRKDGSRNRDRKSLGYPSLGAGECDGLVLKVNALAWDRALLESCSGGQPNLKAHRHPARMIGELQSDFLDLLVGQRRFYFFRS